MLAVLGVPVIFITLVAGLQYAIFATVSRVLSRSAQGIVGQNGTHRVTHEANLPGKTFALVALNEVMIHLISARHNARHRVLIVRARARQQRYSADWDSVVRDLRSVHARWRHIKAVRTQTVQQSYRFVVKHNYAQYTDHCSFLL